MTQEELAFRCNATAGTVSRIETDRHYPGEQLLDMLAVALEVRVYELMARAEGICLPARIQPGNEDEKVLLNHFRGMRMDRRRLLLEVAEHFAQSSTTQ